MMSYDETSYDETRKLGLLERTTSLPAPLILLARSVERTLSRPQECFVLPCVAVGALELPTLFYQANAFIYFLPINLFFSMVVHYEGPLFLLIAFDYLDIPSLQ